MTAGPSFNGRVQAQPPKLGGKAGWNGRRRDRERRDGQYWPFGMEMGLVSVEAVYEGNGEIKFPTGGYFVPPLLLQVLLMEGNSEIQELTSFEDSRLCEELKLACKSLNYTNPTKIQAASLPYSLAGKDLIALAETGSGKTLAFALPVLQHLLDKPTSYFALILAPARQLVVQISDHLKALGARIGLKVAVIIGSMDVKSQVKALSAGPHIVVGTPGKVLFHMQNTKSFAYGSIKHLIMDEADKLLGDDFAGQIDRIVESLPENRQTLLFSATMTDKVEKLERAALRDPVRIAVNSKYQTVDQLSQEYLFFPAKMKDVYLAYIMQQKIGKDIIIFTLTCLAANKVCLLLRKLGHKVVTVNGQMSQAKRLGSLARFRQRDANILVATDVASRGLDIPSVDLVVNYDLPMNPKDYIHRVGRTARAGKGGRSISFITQYDIEQVQKIETLIGKKLQQYSGGQGDIESSVLAIQQMVQEKVRIANDELKLKMEKRGVDEEKQSEKYEKYGKKIQKKKLRNKKKRVTVDV